MTKPTSRTQTGTASLKARAKKTSEIRGGTSGIGALVAVTQLKASSASDDALAGAETQRSLVKKQQTLRETQARIE